MMVVGVGYLLNSSHKRKKGGTALVPGKCMHTRTHVCVLYSCVRTEICCVEPAGHAEQTLCAFGNDSAHVNARGWVGFA